MYTIGEVLWLRLAGDLDTTPDILLENGALDIVQEEIRKGSKYEQILAAVGEVI